MAWPEHEFPFVEDRHRRLAAEVSAFAAAEPAFAEVEPEDGAAATVHFIRRMGEAGLLTHAVCPPDDPARKPDSRSLAIIREVLSYHSAVADCAFAIQGIGSAPVSLFGSEDLRRRYLPGFRDGSLIPALALSEPQSGSDVAGTLTEAREDGDSYVLNGEKTWISNGGIADVYLVVARTGEAPGARGLSAFLVETGTPGFEVAPFEIINSHPIAALRFNDCRIPRSVLLGTRGEGFRVAMANLDIFRPTVGACGIGFARRALDEALAHVSTRQVMGRALSENEVVRMRLADMAVELEQATLAVYQAVWLADCAPRRSSWEASVAKLAATEAAQRIIDQAVQLFGGLGVRKGNVVERLYRDVRPIRIGEGASDVQRMIIARGLLRGRA
ncbi:MAG: acyl-CoA dehydrogenase family protein [Sagittula sp.]|uniref:acyl-CoA dehydrogenase family protein n=1 Tax=Sagittula sp. TaxID=2038081 RepID=UPI004058A1A6